MNTLAERLDAIVAQPDGPDKPNEATIETVAEHIKSLQGRFDRMISILDEGKCDADHAALLGNLLALMVAADLTAIKESLEIFTAACNAQLEQQDAPLRVGFFYTNITETNP